MVSRRLSLLRSTLPDSESVLSAALGIAITSILLDLAGVDVMGLLTSIEGLFIPIVVVTCSKLVERVRDALDESQEIEAEPESV
jgi:hypothetical protein